MGSEIKIKNLCNFMKTRTLKRYNLNRVRLVDVVNVREAKNQKQRKKITIYLNNMKPNLYLVRLDHFERK